VISDIPPPEPPGELVQAPGKPDIEADQKANAEKKDKKSLWKMMVTPVALVLLGVALLPVALSLYPSSTETSAPAYPRVSVLTNLHIAFIDYSAVQVNPSLAQIEVELARGTSSAPVTGVPFASLVVSPPYGTSFRTCPPTVCTEFTGKGQVPAFTWKVLVTFNAKGDAFAYFYVKTKSLGLSVNGLSAQAVIPEAFYNGVGIPEFLVSYHIPAAATYNWSALPPAAFSASTIAWSEPLVQEDTPPKVAVGTNQSRQSSDDHLAFVAGALIGVAGGAVLSAFQEALSRIFK
jgi:hypothetical protein